jgi:hypothetical protein
MQIAPGQSDICEFESYMPSHAARSLCAGLLGCERRGLKAPMPSGFSVGYVPFAAIRATFPRVRETLRSLCNVIFWIFGRNGYLHAARVSLSGSWDWRLVLRHEILLGAWHAVIVSPAVDHW